jgi:hypothetical protein
MEENSFLPHVYSSLGGVLPPGLVRKVEGKVRKRKKNHAATPQ